MNIDLSIPFLPTDMKKDHSNNHLNIGLINFDKYPEGSLFQLKYDPNDYQIPRNENNDIVRISDSYKYSTKVKIFYNGTDIGMLSNDHHNFQGDIFFSIDYNYSFKDFLASYSPQVNIIEDSYSPQVDIIEEVIVFEQGYGDIGNTNRGYTDYKRINFVKNNNDQLNVNLDSKITTDILYNDQSSSHKPFYPLLLDNKYNENEPYYRQGEYIDYADYGKNNEYTTIIGNDNQMIVDEKVLFTQE